MQIEKKYNLQLTVTDTDGLMARILRGSVFSGTLSIKAEEDVFINNSGMIEISGEINKRNDETMDAIAFNENISISSNNADYLKDNNNGTFIAIFTLNDCTIDDIKIRIVNKGASMFAIKMIELTGTANSLVWKTKVQAT